MMMRLMIDQLELNPTAKQVANDLLSAHPNVIFTSGRRNRYTQAHAMAENVVKERDWIQRTYLHAADLQSWVDQNPDAQDVKAIADGLYQVLLAMAPEQLVTISRHLTGDAFDLQPLVDEENLPTVTGTAVIGWLIRRRDEQKDVEKFLDHEGGLCRWHIQCAPSTEV